MQAFLQQTRIAAMMLIVLTVITGLIYPLAMTGIAQGIFPDQADGSLIEKDNQVIGSSLIGQSWVDAETGLTLSGYFRSRPSAAGAGYDSGISGGSNLGPTSDVLKERVAADIAIIRQENNLPAETEIPVDLVTASASGLDPHISRASAELQIARVAAQRGLTEDQVRDLVKDHTQGKFLGFLGEERVNVLELNIALDDLTAQS